MHCSIILCQEILSFFFFFFGKILKIVLQHMEKAYWFGVTSVSGVKSTSILKCISCMKCSPCAENEHAQCDREWCFQNLLFAYRPTCIVGILYFVASCDGST